MLINFFLSLCLKTLELLHIKNNGLHEIYFRTERGNIWRDASFISSSIDLQHSFFYLNLYRLEDNLNSFLIFPPRCAETHSLDSTSLNLFVPFS